MAQRVRRHPDREPGSAAQPIDSEAQAADADRTTIVVQEDRVGLLPGLRTRPTAIRRERRAPGIEICLEGRDRRAPEEADPFLATLAADADLASPEIQRRQGGRGHLAD